MMSPPPVKRGKFEYGNDGLKCLHRTRATPHEIQSVVRLKNEGPITSQTIKYLKSNYPRDWWEAQIKLYGIECSQFNIANMKDSLSRELRGFMMVAPKVQQMEHSMAKEYRDSAKDYAAREKAEELPRKVQGGKLDRKLEGPRNALTDFSRPAYDALRRSSTREHSADHSVMDEINQLHSKLLRTGPGNDVGGTWRIDCAEISSWCGDSMDSNTDIIWKIHQPQNSESFVWGEIS